MFVIQLLLIAIYVRTNLYAATLLDLNSGRLIKLHSAWGVFNGFGYIRTVAPPFYQHPTEVGPDWIAIGALRMTDRRRVNWPLAEISYDIRSLDRALESLKVSGPERDLIFYGYIDHLKLHREPTGVQWNYEEKLIWLIDQEGNLVQIWPPVYN